ncbi:HEAT repeat domain-containing protein [Membranihabitans marinus]|uniref:HEAT repeat domain-containing protein n=1 Tax=Membranihabitans marinus TaxID=1227546 RepID=UPI001F29F26A|nr:HEAT repeat domain-containing protein [Membranihabitans marinus]
MKLNIYILFFGLLLGSCKESIPPIYPNRSVELKPEQALEISKKLQQEVNVTVADPFELTLWASDTLVNDPIAISIDDQGRVFYTSAIRQTHSEFDIRQHKNWMTASISFKTVEDRRAFLRKTFEADSEESKRFLKDLNNDGVRDWRDLTVEKEEIWFVEDNSGDGIANRSQLYLQDFHEEITDVANGIEVHDGEVYIAIGPDFWRTKDIDGDLIADKTESISHGYAVHIGFGGHGMSGATIGPAGRIWWGIGDIGANIIDKEGKQHAYPNEGIIVRSDIDGSNFEVFAHGLRNTHEFVFDKYGNLITEDNDSDQRGERERLTYLIDGSDSGWRINWQFGKYTDSTNNGYKVWMDEKMHIPRWKNQAAYFLPPITNYINGPTGLVYNPGTALSPDWYDHFFIAEFRGTPARSPLHAFTLASDGAGFKLDKTQEVVNGLLPTGLDFGPDGSLYFGDWIDGWDPKRQGRIWKLDIPGQENSPIRAQTKEILQSNFSNKKQSILSELLYHQDLRVRKKAQFELVKRGEDGFEILNSAINQRENPIARIHGIWGISQLARQVDKDYASVLVPLLRDQDPEICAQAAKYLGDVKYHKAEESLIPLLNHYSPRVQLFAVEALGRIESENAVHPILDLVERNDNKDTWLRHAAAIALARIDDADPLLDLVDDPSKAKKIVAVVALRRMSDKGVARFLQDDSQYIVAEAARAINDDLSIPEALEDLANILTEKRINKEVILRRAINANLRVGNPENIDNLIEFIQMTSAPAAMRAEAIATLSSWSNPSLFDRVDGRYRGPLSRDASMAREKLNPLLPRLLREKNNIVQLETVAAIGRLKIDTYDQKLINLLYSTTDADIKKTILNTLNTLQSSTLEIALERSLTDKNAEVRSEALKLLPKSNISPQQSIKLFKKVLRSGTISEQQAALIALRSISSDNASTILTESMNQLIAKRLPREIELDLIETVELQEDENLKQLLQTYNQSKDSSDIVDQYREALYGGDAGKGRRLFYNHPEAQCIRCHAVFEVGGNAGPGLAEVGKRLTRAQILESLIDPSAAYAQGYGIVSTTLNNGETLAGTVVDEDEASLVIKMGKGDIKTIAKSDIKERKNSPSSMPNMKTILKKSEMRDIVAFLSGLKEIH